MSRTKSRTEVTNHKDKALSKLDNYLVSQIGTNNPNLIARADKLAYWIEDYANFLKKEETFDSSKGIKYKKGDIVKVHLGFRLGREEGGLHFGIVVDVNNSKYSDVVTIIPLTSLKPDKEPHPNSVALGSEIFQAIISKHDRLHSEITTRASELTEMHKALDSSYPAGESNAQKILDELKRINAKIDELNEIRKSIIKMKDGSVALVNQIITISKLRIYDPVYSHSVLYGIRLSPTTISSVDEKIAELYLNNAK